MKKNKIIEIFMKILIVLGTVLMLIGIVVGVIISIKYNNDAIGLIVCLVFMWFALVCILLPFGLAAKMDKEFDPKDFVIKHYNCGLLENLEERFKKLYGKIIYSQTNPKNFYSAFYKSRGDQVYVIAVMHVDATFSEDKYMEFMNAIPELFEKVISHVLIVIFIEDEKSEYLKEIMYTPEFNDFYDIKIFSVYDEQTKRLKINKTKSGSGNQDFNIAKKELTRILDILPKEKKPKEDKRDDNGI